MRSEGHYTKRSGIANAGASEVAYLCWLGRQPSLSTKSRMHVDPGTDVYVDFMSKVPLQPDRDLLKVDLATKEKIFPGDGEHLPSQLMRSQKSPMRRTAQSRQRGTTQNEIVAELSSVLRPTRRTPCALAIGFVWKQLALCVCVRCEDN